MLYKLFSYSPNILSFIFFLFFFFFFFSGGDNNKISKYSKIFAVVAHKHKTRKASVKTDFDTPSQIWTPLPNVPFKHPLYHIWQLILFAILFIDVRLKNNTTFLNKDKEKQPFRSNSTAFIIASRTVYARTKREQTTAFELLKLLQ